MNHGPRSIILREAFLYTADQRSLVKICTGGLIACFFKVVYPAYSCICLYVFFFYSVHYVKNPGAVLEPGSIVAKLELDDPSKVTQVRMVIAFIYF